MPEFDARSSQAQGSSTQSIKPPVWTWEIPTYFAVGGAAGAAAVIAAIAGLSGIDREAAADARWIAAAGAAISPLLLISDLGRPARFLNMLRVFKLQSPMSVGAWTLVVFSGAVFTSLGLTTLSGPAMHPLVRATTAILDVVAALSGLVLATYTGVLIGATAIPIWARQVRWLPVLFGASALCTAVALVELAGHRTSALNAAGIGAAALETLASAAIALNRDRNAAAGSAAARGMVAAGGLLTGPIPLVVRLAAGHIDSLRILAAAVTIGGTLLARFGWLALGRSSVTR